MRRLLSLMLATTMCLTMSACSVVETTSNEKLQLSLEQKLEDFEYMFNTIKDGYPFLEVDKRLNNVDWLANKEKYVSRIENTENDQEFISVMELIISDLNDHTHLISDSNSYKFFRDGYSDFGWYDFLDSDKVVNRYSENDDSVEGSSDSNVEKNSQREEVIVKDIINEKIGYMYLPEMYSNEEYKREDIKIIGEYIDTIKNHQALIIDIRGNPGGDTGYWEDIVSLLIDEDMKTSGYMLFRDKNKVVKDYVEKRDISLQPIENLPKEVLDNAPKEINKMFDSFSVTEFPIKAKSESKFEGNIYLLVDEAVYSSSESFAIFCKENNFATIIGQKTSGDGGGIDPLLFNLKNSGLIVRMSSNMYLTKSGECNEEFKTKPDYEIENVSRTVDFKDDMCINKVLEIENIK